ncbi:hypothetical protein G3580_14395 [Nitrogeniibacter mangrovi]|uniref:Uncharacterized protein n=1 Tax=Nitrogeniibacter mangrovi TaxID=2016596 RepID=A0A6C1B4S1_9RHOO|nr:hypothetical protein [Nitrogeniibacter mangrovi]QID18706.1 hypothetical protein G3580_14395 [Nitrogeniibacter mangrovi]
MKIRTTLLCLTLVTVLTGCEELGIPDAKKEAARKEAEGEAIGSACRQSGRALEDCYARNPKASKAAIFSGWRSMNDYMTENNIPTIAPADEAPHEPPAGEAGHDAAPAAGEGH